MPASVPASPPRPSMPLCDLLLDAGVPFEVIQDPDRVIVRAHPTSAAQRERLVQEVAALSMQLGVNFHQLTPT